MPRSKSSLGSVAYRFWTVFPCAYEGTRIAGPYSATTMCGRQSIDLRNVDRFLRSACLPSRSDPLPFNHSAEIVSMNNADDKPKVGRDWIAFVIAWIPYSLLTYRFWHNVDDAFISFRYAKNWAMGYGTSLQPGASATGGGI